MSSRKLLLPTGAALLAALVIAGACYEESPVAEIPCWDLPDRCGWGGAIATSSSARSSSASTASESASSDAASASSGADYPTGPVGEGCRIAPASSFDGYVSASWGDGAKVVDGEIYLLTFTGKPEDLVLELVRVSDGEPLVALRWKNDKCGPPGARATEAFVY